MDKTDRVIILYAKFGDGHVQVSKALQKEFKRQGAQNVHLVDLFTLAHPIITSFTRFVYLKSFSLLPRVYGWSYKRTKNMDHNKMSSHLFNSFGIKKLREIIETIQPSVVVNTFPMQVMPEFMQREKIHIPTFTVMTDFELHHRWIHPAIDHFYVATSDLKEQIVKAGISPEKISVSGIPIRHDFEASIPKEKVYEKYGLTSNKDIVLLMAGADAAVQHLKELCESLASKPNVELIFICGRNNELKEQLQQELMYPNLHVFGFVERIHEIMSISSCIVTKAGGVTLSEALAMQLPIIIFSPVPGQEEENAAYIMDKGAAIVVNQFEHIAVELEKLLSDPTRLLSMKEAARNIHQHHSSETIVNDIDKRIRMLPS